MMGYYWALILDKEDVLGTMEEGKFEMTDDPVDCLQLIDMKGPISWLVGPIIRSLTPHIEGIYDQYFKGDDFSFSVNHMTKELKPNTNVFSSQHVSKFLEFMESHYPDVSQE
jgi:hypothetical protein